MRRVAFILLALLLGAGTFAEGTNMKYDFTTFTNVTLTGVDISALSEDEQSALYQAARYCQAMTEADIDTMRQIVSEDMTFTHMSGRTQTREEYFADVADGSLTYYAIGMEHPVVEVDGDVAAVTYTAALTANAYGARGTFRMKGTHWYRRIDGAWKAINRPE